MLSEIASAITIFEFIGKILKEESDSEVSYSKNYPNEDNEIFSSDIINNRKNIIYSKKPKIINELVLLGLKGKNKNIEEENYRIYWGLFIENFITNVILNIKNYYPIAIEYNSKNKYFHMPRTKILLTKCGLIKKNFIRRENNNIYLSNNRPCNIVLSKNSKILKPKIIYFKSDRVYLCNNFIEISDDIFIELLSNLTLDITDNLMVEVYNYEKRKEIINSLHKPYRNKNQKIKNVNSHNILFRTAGKVLWYKKERKEEGFGFIDPGYGNSVFIHALELKKSGLTFLVKDQIIIFDIDDKGKKGLNALNIEVVK